MRLGQQIGNSGKENSGKENKPPGQNGKELNRSGGQRKKINFGRRCRQSIRTERWQKSTLKRKPCQP
eukprot:5730716-Amphidinium_carterae.2